MVALAHEWAARRAVRLGPRAAHGGNGRAGGVPAVPRLRRAGDDVRHADVALRRADAGARAGRPRRGAARAGRAAARARQPPQGGQAGRARTAARRARRRAGGRARRRRRPRRSAPASARSRRAGRAAGDAARRRTTPPSCGGWRTSSLPDDAEVADGVHRAARRGGRAGRGRLAPTRSAPPRWPRCCAQALGLRDPTGDCPVCGTPDILDGEWAEHAAQRGRGPRRAGRRAARGRGRRWPPPAAASSASSTPRRSRPARNRARRGRIAARREASAAARAELDPP